MLPSDLIASLERIEEVRCLNEANNSPQVAALDNLALDLAKNWKPTGFYSPSELEAMIGQLTSAGATARFALTTASLSTSDAAMVIAQAKANLDRDDKRSEIYRKAIRDARSTNTVVINAPGFKGWVTDSLVNISQAYVTIYALDCRTTWLDTAAQVAAGIVSAAKAVGGVVAQAGQAVVTVAETLFSPLLRWILVGGVLLFGGMFVYKHGRRLYLDEVHPRLPRLPRLPRFDDDGDQA